MANLASSTTGQYLAARLWQAGMRHYFAVPGDYNLVLLDELLKHPDLMMINTCNELNAAYAADGYARASDGPAAVVFTFSVGGLSAINGIAGAYAESLPLSPSQADPIQTRRPITSSSITPSVWSTTATSVRCSPA